MQRAPLPPKPPLVRTSGFTAFVNIKASQWVCLQSRKCHAVPVLCRLTKPMFITESTCGGNSYR